MFRFGLLSSIVARIPQGDTLPVGRLAGVSVFLHPSTVLLFGIVQFGLMRGLGRTLLPDLEWVPLGAACGGLALLLMSAVLIHELGHAFVARREGVPVCGVHLSLLGGVTLLAREPRSALSEVRIALAGPGASLFVALIAGAACRVVAEFDGAAFLVATLGLVAITNLFLATFNAFPALPLDGGKALRAMLWHLNGCRARSTVLAARSGRWFAFTLVACGLACVVQGQWWGVGVALFGWFVGESATGAAARAAFELAESQASAGSVEVTARALESLAPDRLHERKPSTTKSAIPGQLPSMPKRPPVQVESPSEVVSKIAPPRR